MIRFETTNGVLQDKEVQQIVTALKQGAVIAFPTETVYGIGCLVDQSPAIDKIYAIKDRKSSKPLSLHISSRDIVQKYIKRVPTYFGAFVAAFWPGPVTAILYDEQKQTAGFRYPDCPVALQLIEACGGKIFATSANVSGARSPISANDVINSFGSVIDILVDGGTTRFKTDSTVVILSDDGGDIVRRGANAEGVQDFFNALHTPQKDTRPMKHILFVCTGNTCRSPMGEGWLRWYLKSIGKDHLFQVESCGVYACDGMTASSGSLNKMKQEGIDIAAHRSQSVSRSMIERADVIFCMSFVHKKEILNFAPKAEDKIVVLNVDDPIGFGGDVYQNCFNNIVTGIKEHLDIILKMAQ
ncbi:MAG: threonylcarbamoyl-AMP synthase [Candidatus Omnitrophica bacterium]|nr:threonylcarbamoyl-AMP synthase [Candidatus Omnitrophota bacterium]